MIEKVDLKNIACQKDAWPIAESNVFTVKKGSILPKNMKTEKKKKEEAKIRYAKEFFVTERGEVIKMGAIITPNPHIRGKLLMAKQELE